MSLPRIPNTEPVVQPATEEKSYPDLYLMHLNIMAQPDGPVRANGTLRPYNYDTDEIGPKEQRKNVHIADLATLAAERAAADKPLLAQAMNNLLAALTELVAERQV